MQRMFCAAPPAPAVVFNPTSAFKLGSAGDTSCPSGTATVLNPADCQKAAGSAARLYGGAVRVTGPPAGCFWLRVGAGSFFLNDAVGQSNAYAQPVCAGAPECSLFRISLACFHSFTGVLCACKPRPTTATRLGSSAHTSHTATRMPAALARGTPCSFDRGARELVHLRHQQHQCLSTTNGCCRQSHGVRGRGQCRGETVRRHGGARFRAGGVCVALGGRQLPLQHQCIRGRPRGRAARVRRCAFL
jgi:hypothetical protein